jgi:hypothetical protein
VTVDGRGGHYLGTEVDGDWWHRYTREGLLARGRGVYWYDDQAFRFARFLAREPIVIPFDQVEELQVGTWHAGRWAWGKPIIKLVWTHQGQSLSSGFVLSGGEPELRQLRERMVNRQYLRKIGIDIQVQK